MEKGSCDVMQAIIGHTEKRSPGVIGRKLHSFMNTALSTSLSHLYVLIRRLLHGPFIVTFRSRE